MARPDAEGLGVAAFEAHVAGTDQLGNALDTPLLGLVGEVGSLVSALKKKRRDSDGFFGYHEAVVEELGDVLWYLSATARRGGTSLAEAMTQGRRGKAAARRASFADIQAPARPHRAAFDTSLLELAGSAGEIARRFVDGRYEAPPQALREDIGGFIALLARAAGAAGVSLEEAARHNVGKTEDRWPAQQHVPAPFDEQSHIDEQLPRSMRVLVYERQVNRTNYVFIKSGGILIGDRLTDNHSPPDDYRFHDIFHLAHAAVLGWSPTLRALLRVKRKSERSIDENEDGARAILIEEGLATWIFETAKRHRFFANTPTLGLDLLKDVKQFVRGYEAERLPMWLWESAILQGYSVFRMLRDHRRGVVRTDLHARKIWYEPMTEEDLAECGLELQPAELALVLKRQRAR